MHHNMTPQAVTLRTRPGKAQLSTVKVIMRLLPRPMVSLTLPTGIIIRAMRWPEPVNWMLQ